jgi:hypothetical protein
MNKKSDQTWLATSLFCSRSYWADLMVDGIKPFIQQRSNEGMLRSFLMEFNYQTGHNLRLMLRCDTKHAEALAGATDTYFKAFFASAGFLSETEPGLHLHGGLFLPFPHNSIKYGLYRIEKKAFDFDNKRYHFRYGLSLLLLDAFCKESVHDESILVLAFYMNMCWIQVLLAHDFNNPATLFEPYHVPDTPNLEKLSDDTVEEMFEENKEMLFAIADEIGGLNEPCSNGDLAWLKKWEHLCKNELDSISDIITVHKTIVSAINQHLCLSYNMTLLLSYFIREVCAHKYGMII